MAIKNENAQWQDILGIVKHAIALKNIQWQVKQLQQPENIGLTTGCIYISRIDSSRLGWQAHRDKYINGEMKHSEEYIEQITYQISAFKKRNSKDIAELTSSDVLNSLITFFMSKNGVQYIRSLGYQTFRISQLRQPVFVTDSENYEKNPSFDITLVLSQTDVEDENYTNLYEIDLKGV